MYIKDWIRSIALKLFVSFLQGGEEMKSMLVISPSCKWETNNFLVIVPIQSLISIKWSLKWALDEVSMTKLM